MSYITFDYRCPQCGHQEPRLVKRNVQDAQFHECDENTRRLMVKLPANPKTTFRYADTKLKD
ncbi:MAG: FmdB family zinc ribbon protein [Planctomycetota bacterium]|jgi:hypothetical protein